MGENPFVRKCDLTWISHKKIWNHLYHSTIAVNAKRNATRWKDLRLWNFQKFWLCKCVGLWGGNHFFFILFFVWKLHQSLISFPLKLNRFAFDYVTFNRIKLNDQVRFPKILDLNKVTFMNQREIPLSFFFSEDNVTRICFCFVWNRFLI